MSETSGPAGDSAATLQQAVRRALDNGGALQRALPGYQVRSQQLQIAQAVAGTLHAGGALVVEAATGVGKTFAYLVPILLSGQRVLLSTATKALQDQLFTRDLPTVSRALGLPVRSALLKGRSNYLCLRRLELASQDAELVQGPLRQDLARVQRWAHSTRSGDLAELPGLDEQSPLRPLVTSTRDNCLGTDCPMYRQCHVVRARREAMAADVVVVNHHLFFADLAVRESGIAELLPSVDALVFDEAHKLNEIGVQFLGQQLSSGQLQDLGRDLLMTGLQQARGLADWRELAGELKQALRQLRLVLGGRRSHPRRLRWAREVPDDVDPGAWSGALDRLQSVLAALGTALQPLDELGPDMRRLYERSQELGQRLQAFRQPGKLGYVRWVDAGAGLRVVQAPLDIAGALGPRVFPDRPEPGAAGSGAGSRPGARSWIFTSATLGDDRDLSWFLESCGLDAAQAMRVDSPFDYQQQATLYVPRNFPLPSASGHADAVARLAAQGATRLGGRTLVLTTTLRAMRSIGAGLAAELQGSEIQVLVQGQQAKRVLLQRLQDGAQHGRPGCVVVASASFWEGVDIPGDALQLLVIDKLPFPPPADPLVEARCRRLEQQGQSPFAHYSLPVAAIALKQGAGRLIRSVHDRGIIAICDVRLRQRSYGKRLLSALPPMHLIDDERQFMASLKDLEPTTNP